MKQIVAVLTSKSRLRQQLAVPLYRNALFLISSNALTGIFGLVFWLVAAKLYDADTVGLASAAISAMLLLSTLGTLGLDYAIIRFLPQAASGAAMINTSLTVSALAASLISVVFVAGVGLWSPVLLFIRNSALLFSWFVIFTVAYTLYLIQTRTFVARRRAEFNLLQSMIFNVLRVVLLAVFALSFGVFGIASAWGIAGILALVLGILLFQPMLEAGYRPVPTVARGVLGQLVRYSFTNYIAVMLWIAPGYILPLLVANLVGSESNAYFYIAWSMANILFQVPLAISFSLFAEGSSDEKHLGQNVWKSLRFTFLTVVPLALLLLVFAGPILGAFDPQYAEEAAGLLRILVVSAVPLSINCLYFVVERVRMRMARVIAMNALVTVATLALSWALLPRMDLIGAGIAWIASQSVAALWVILLFVMRRRTRSDGREQAEPGP